MSLLTTTGPLSYTARCTPSIQTKFRLLCRHFQLDLNWREETKYQRLGQAVLSRLGSSIIYIVGVSSS